MKIYIEKESQLFRVYSPELQRIKEDIFFPDKMESKANNVADALMDFNDVILREFIEYFFIEHKGDALDLPDCKTVEYIFDDASFYDYYLADPTVYGRETVSDEISKHSRKTRHGHGVAPSFPGHDKLMGDALVQNLDNADPTNPFYDKKVVFTGVLEAISRGDAAAKVKALGADINSSISGSTDFVIVGADAGPSKMKKIADYNAKGASIKIISESEFLQMI